MEKNDKKKKHKRLHWPSLLTYQVEARLSVKRKKYTKKEIKTEDMEV
jgi:hypothetical protein